MRLKFLAAPIAAFLFLGTAGLASAHAVVKPAEVGIAAFQTFTLGVPSEKEVPTTSLRLVLSDGLNFVTPNVKLGWKVELKKQATGKQVEDDDGMMVAEEKAVELVWTGGSIPGGQRDEFSFSAQAPAKPATLIWKAYQTYADGSTVSWDADPKAEQPKDADGDSHSHESGPYSQTMVIDDLAASSDATSSSSTEQSKVESVNSKKVNTAFVLAALALAFSVSAWFMARKKSV